MSVLRRLGPYEVVNKIGEGGMGAVYLARDRRDGSSLALKVLHPTLATQPAARTRFSREGELGKLVGHPNVVAILELGEAQLSASRRSLYMAMEHVPGRDLLHWSAREELGTETAVSIGAQIASALVAAHAVGIVHRDVKPGNILYGRKRIAKLLDFGLAKRMAGVGAPVGEDELVLRTGSSFVGTLGYAAPEQLLGDGADEKSDLFGLGVVLYQLLSGQLPYRGVSLVEQMVAVERGAQPLAALMPGLPPRLSEVVMALVAARPNARPESAREVARELEALLDGSLSEPGVEPAPSPVAPASAAERARHRVRHRVRTWSRRLRDLFRR